MEVASKAKAAELVWTNPSFGTGLTTVTIDGDFKDCKFLIIEVRDMKVAVSHAVVVPFDKIFAPEILAPCLYLGTRIYFGARELACTDTQITIGECEIYNTYGSNTIISTGNDRNDCLVPLRVYKI